LGDVLRNLVHATPPQKRRMRSRGISLFHQQKIENRCYNYTDGKRVPFDINATGIQNDEQNEESENE
jgi:hypothetical protein